MRTTIDLNDELMRRIKRLAADQGVTFRELVERALRGLLERKAVRKGYTLQWRTEKGQLMPGVRLDDRDALFDLMDGRG
jgi:predicted transcriptional regulator